MDLITITYTPAVQFASDVAVQQICSTWSPANTASDNAVFAGTYYQTNKWDNGTFEYFTSLEKFLASQVAHPGLVAALRAAVRAYVPAQPAEGDTPAVPAQPGVYEWEAPDGEALYVEELIPALKDQGFTFEPGSSSAEG